LNNIINYLLTRKNLNLFWNFGRILGFILFIQIFSGIFLIIIFRNDRIFSFFTIQFLIFDLNFGWIFRLIHINFVSFFFVFIFLHFLKRIFFMRYNLKKVWNVGVFILLFLMLESFLGYVLIWRQIRFWACTVITRLLIVIPFFGITLLNWIWGNFYVSILTLKVFFLIHFILPFIIFLIVFFHLNFLHFYTSKRNFYISRNFDKIFFILFLNKRFL
jgi:quinol-cytochrome oxidoreductase complex cytochrome b subunit